ncbi:MAG: PD-(D/E)XK nuclease family protein [Fuerstiella sp.]
MPVTRKFLDWNRPALPAAADFLVERYSMMGAADLSGVVVVVPGRRAGRRLLELLIEAADQKLVRLTPPVIETVGTLPERLYESRKRFAAPLVNKFAWTAALRQARPEDIRRIIPDPPTQHDISRWLSFGELLWKQHRELAAEGLDFQDVITRGAEVDAFDEAERWQVLRSVQESCLGMLDDLELWDLQSARLFAIKHQECRTDCDIVLVGTPDLNLAAREMLDQVADRVTALIHAPQKLSRRFDDYGCIIPDVWSNVLIPLQSAQLEVVEGPTDQAGSVVSTLAGYQGRYRPDEVTVGVTDERLVPEIARYLADAQVPSRWVVGQNLTESRPYKLLAAVAEFLETERFDAFASLIRHTDLDAWLYRQPVPAPKPLPESDDDKSDVDQANGAANGEIGGTVDGDGSAEPAVTIAETSGSMPPTWLQQVDDYFNQHLPATLSEWLGVENKYDRIQHVHRCVSELLQPLSDGELLLGEWARPLTDLLMTVYDDVAFNVEIPEDAWTLASCRKIYELLLTHSDIPVSLMPKVSAAQAVRLLLNELGSESVPPLPDDEAVELLGWLELPLDDSPALVVTNFNDGYVPSALNSDAFLPNTLRRHLGLLDNRRRYARDAYALSVLVASRRDLKLIVGRRDLRGDPLRPSRLMFAADETEIARRVLTCFGSAEAEMPRLAEAAEAGGDDVSSGGFFVPRPQPRDTPPERIGVTGFRTYLACPYRYYLRHVLHLKQVDDSANELNAMMFGNLMHEVLNRFGMGSLKASTDVRQIQQELRGLLDDCVAELLGESRLAAVNVQIMQLRTRLDAFARWQADWAAQGWQIRFSELSFKDLGVTLKLADGRRIELDGRVDRIDQLGGTNQYVIFDYKSGETARTPRQAHQKKGEWIDLQLPLYRLMARQIGITGELQLGYITLPRDTRKVQPQMADWTEEELADAERRAVEVATSIADQNFWPPAEVNPIYFPEFAAICQDTAFDREVIV